MVVLQVFTYFGSSISMYVMNMKIEPIYQPSNIPKFNEEMKAK